MDGKFLGLPCGQTNHYQSHGIENCVSVVLLFTKRFHEGNLDVMISLFLSLCESWGINIMFVVLLLNGGEWCKLWSNNATTKGRFCEQPIGKGVCVNEYCDGGVKRFRWTKRVPNSLGPSNVCLNYSFRFCTIILMWVLKQHLSNFLIMFYRVNRDINIPRLIFI
jgi:hypothetical protein